MNKTHLDGSGAKAAGDKFGNPLRAVFGGPAIRQKAKRESAGSVAKIAQAWGCKDLCLNVRKLLQFDSVANAIQQPTNILFVYIRAIFVI
ncbi:MAG: hypothetical protein B7X59_00490 [Polaromonas sp. 39-63-203]|jgi:hypothetical protein|nr:MAG: hypothetical protein B7Y54_01825 [Polaromonas sp. 35-63-240]OYZ03416.1 MAG: hypothetical protein B7Y42_00675 [Polaromonas sp. 28-63-22]OYZ85279.1 MAG: hypothetical protein B7Y03_00335 [Polaromonas sp. 24-62-144]OZB02419.1 MAG: hypothetical protein B7X59_00490 [Polaromonas sp. 39-63-203]